MESGAASACENPPQEPERHKSTVIAGKAEEGKLQAHLTVRVLHTSDLRGIVPKGYERSRRNSCNGPLPETVPGGVKGCPLFYRAGDNQNRI